MLVNQKDTSEVLRQMVSRLTPDRATEEDLIQEAFLHPWLRKKQRLGFQAAPAVLRTDTWLEESLAFAGSTGASP